MPATIATDSDTNKKLTIPSFTAEARWSPVAISGLLEPSGFDRTGRIDSSTEVPLRRITYGKVWPPLANETEPSGEMITLNGHQMEEGKVLMQNLFIAPRMGAAALSVPVGLVRGLPVGLEFDALPVGLNALRKRSGLTMAGDSDPPRPAAHPPVAAGPSR